MKDFLVVTEQPVERVLRFLVGLALLSLVFVGPTHNIGIAGDVL
jgi:hypothetical protein